MRAHSSLRLGTLRGTTPELLASSWYGAWGFCVVGEAGLPHKTSSLPTQRRNGRACSSLTARGGGLPVGVIRTRPAVPSAVEFIPIKSWVTKGSDAPGNCARHSTVPSRDHGCPPSTGESGLSQYDTA